MEDWGRDFGRPFCIRPQTCHSVHVPRRGRRIEFCFGQLVCLSSKFKDSVVVGSSVQGFISGSVLPSSQKWCSRIQQWCRLVKPSFPELRLSLSLITNLLFALQGLISVCSVVTVFNPFTLSLPRCVNPLLLTFGSIFNLVSQPISPATLSRYLQRQQAFKPILFKCSKSSDFLPGSFSNCLCDLVVDHNKEQAARSSFSFRYIYFDLYQEIAYSISL